MSIRVRNCNLNIIFTRAGYKPWQKLQEATYGVLEEVCKNCSKFKLQPEDKDSLMTAAGEKTLRNSYGLHGHNESIIQLDALKCSVSVFHGQGESEESEDFCLAEGDEPNSAFQFTVKDLNIILTRKFTDIWPKASYELDY